MGKEARRLSVVVLGSLPCFVFPVAIVMLSQTYAFDRLPRDEDYQSWPLHTIDALLWIDVCFTALLIAWMRGWRVWVAVIAVPLLCVTGVLAVTGGRWVEGTYF